LRSYLWLKSASSGTPELGLDTNIILLGLNATLQVAVSTKILQEDDNLSKVLDV